MVSLTSPGTILASGYVGMVEQSGNDDFGNCQKTRAGFWGLADRLKEN